MIDLHTHTNQSDGTYSPQELVEEATAIGLEALAITDHDTFTGYDLAREHADRTGLRLHCGIELSTKFDGYTVHLLGYFLQGQPAPEFREWITEMQRSRHDRNVRMIERLRSLGVDISLDEVQVKGRSLTGRPHFARVLVEKGYVKNTQQAFDDYLDESAKGYVNRDEPQLEQAIERIAKGGGISSIAHPVRLARNDYGKVEELVGQMRDVGLQAIEVFHSDHKPADVRFYSELASRYGLKMTGGSDFHGGNKPNIRLGRGTGNLDIALEVLEQLYR